MSMFRRTEPYSSNQRAASKGSESAICGRGVRSTSGYISVECNASAATMTGKADKAGFASYSIWKEM